MTRHHSHYQAFTNLTPSHLDEALGMLKERVESPKKDQVPHVLYDKHAKLSRMVQEGAVLQEAHLNKKGLVGIIINTCRHLNH